MGLKQVGSKAIDKTADAIDKAGDKVSVQMPGSVIDPQARPGIISRQEKAQEIQGSSARPMNLGSNKNPKEPGEGRGAAPEVVKGGSGAPEEAMEQAPTEVPGAAQDGIKGFTGVATSIATHKVRVDYRLVRDNSQQGIIIILMTKQQKKEIQKLADGGGHRGVVGSEILPEAGESAGTNPQDDVGAEGEDFNKSGGRQ